MSKVFLAYKRVDIDRANTVRTKLEALEIPLFIDLKQTSGESYFRTINAELSSAAAVLVLWTEAAIRMPAGETNFVVGEAQRGNARGVLVAATLDKEVVDHLPVPFNTLHTSDLSDWMETGASAHHQGWQNVLDALGRKLNRPGLPDLAIAMENPSDEPKRKFLREHPDDPYSRQIVARFEVLEREAFEARFLTAQKRIQQRTRDAERKLRSCREDFESQLVQMRGGHNFMPPDPVKALDDNVAKLRNLIEIHETTIDQERVRADRAEDLAATANAEIVALNDKLGSHASSLEAQNAAIEQLNSDLAKRDAQIANHESTIASQATELAKLVEAVTNTRQALEAKDTRISELGDMITSHKQRQQGETQRLMMWSGAAAVLAACVFTVIGWSLTPSGSTQSGAIVQTPNAQIATLTTQNQALQKQASDAAALNSKISALTTQNQALQKQASDAATLNSKISTLTTQNEALQAQVSKLQANTGASQAPSTTIPLDAQCDTLAGYQYDPDRPPSNGWVLAIKDIPTTQATCQSALQTAGIDQITQRRLLLELARTYVESAPVDYNAYVDNLNKASRLGSSQADYQLGMYYAAHDNSQLAWDKIQRSAAAHNPVALNRAAISQIFPDWNEHFITGRALDSGFQYLQQALDAAYYRSYYVAGAAYWTYKDRDTPDRSKAIYFLTVSQCVTDKRDPNTDKEGADYRDGADYFYFKKTGKHLTCLQ